MCVFIIVIVIVIVICTFKCTFLTQPIFGTEYASEHDYSFPKLILLRKHNLKMRFRELIEFDKFP